VTVPSRTG